MIFWEVDILRVDFLGVDILGVDILGVDILGVDILGRTHLCLNTGLLVAVTELFLSDGCTYISWVLALLE